MPSAATWMDLGFMRLSEATKRKTNIIYHLYVELKNFKLNFSTKQKDSQTEKKNNLTVIKVPLDSCYFTSLRFIFLISKM